MSQMHVKVAMVSAAILVAGTWVGLVRSQDPAKEKLSDRLGDAVQSVKRGAEKVGDGVREGAGKVGEGVKGGYDRARASVHNMDIHTRVYGRIHWDKDLHTAALRIEVRDSSVVVLKGAVPDLSAKAKAIELARDTFGVTSVVDEMGIGSPPTGATTTTTTKTTTTKETKPKK